MAYQRTNTEIGRGGYGIVYHANDSTSGQVLAWKELLSTALSDDEKKRFAREVKIQSTLSHKHIVRILAARVDSEPFVVVMPLALGSLRTKFTSVFGNDALVNKIFSQVCSAVRYAHANGVVHRDLKPENILFFAPDDVKVSDFGLAKRINAESITVTRTGDFGGSVPYSAPEQYISLKDVDHRADIFSLGKILYELYTGNLPLTLHLAHRSLPTGIKYVIQRACDPDPDTRYQNVSDLMDDFLIATGQRVALTNPEQIINDLLLRVINGESVSDSLIQEVDRLFTSQSGDAAFYMKFLVKLPKHLILEYFVRRPQGFSARLDEYNAHISGGLPFNYTDTVADFYSAIFESVPDHRIQLLVLSRLFGMGHSHNRWYVRDAFCGLIQRLNDQALILAVRDLLRSNYSATKWHKETCSNGGLSEILRAEFSKIKDDDE